MTDKEPKAIRINVLGSDEYYYIGPFVGFEDAALFGELSIEAFEVIDYDEIPKGIHVPTPESVDLVNLLFDK